MSEGAGSDWGVLVNGAQVASGDGDLPGRIGAQRVILGAAPGEDAALRQGLNVIGISGGSGPGMLLYAGRLDTREPLAEAAGEDRGIAVERRYCLVQDGVSGLPDGSGTASAADECVPASAVRQDQLVEVQLVVTVPESSYYVTITDPHPAGFVQVPRIPGGCLELRDR